MYFVVVTYILFPEWAWENRIVHAQNNSGALKAGSVVLGVVTLHTCNKHRPGHMTRVKR